MTSLTQTNVLADLYAGLANVLAEAGRGAVPSWLKRPGREWPLFAPAQELAARLDHPALSQAVAAMAEVTGGSRLAECKRLFVGNGRPPIMLYESWHVDGRFPSPTTFAVQAVYRHSGLNLAGELISELPDHAAVELEYLSFLTEREEEDAGQAQEWRSARRRFLKEHANRWLPQVAQRLAQSNDEGWAAVGLLLTAVLTLSDRPRRNDTNMMLGLPTMTAVSTGSVQAVSDCTLCGFCAQVCPTRALRMSEDERTTRLYLLPEACIHCGKCAQVCDERVMVMGGEMVEETACTELTEVAVLLRESPRLACPRCGQPTVSQAEINAIVRRLGEHPAWLDVCIQCR
ncbi:MAG: 4Fe-4S dicluster domain-containing protein [Chloroflexi bacterium]|nr:4Fe-4S dicluster domain-containing protein [Chloroflexota bacterium]